jgi:hypothetical protein
VGAHAGWQGEGQEERGGDGVSAALLLLPVFALVCLVFATRSRGVRAGCGCSVAWLRASLLADRARARCNAHRQAAIDRQLLAQHVRRADLCPLERMHFINARAAWRAAHGKGARP